MSPFILPRRAFALGGFAACALVLGLWATPAAACAGPVVSDPWRPVPAPGAEIPANAPALTLSPVHGPRYDGRPDPSPVLPPLSAADAGIAVVRPDGGLLPVTVVDKTVWLQGPLEPNASYRFEYGTMVGDGGSRYSFEFAAGPAAPFPSSPGQLSVQTSGGTTDVPGSSACRFGARAAVATFSLSPSAEMKPWLPLAGWELKVDGARWASAEPGSIDPQGTAAKPGQFSTSRDFMKVYSVCPDGQPSGALPGLPEGPHEAVLEAHVAGLDASIASAPVQFRVECGGCGCGSAGLGAFVPALLFLGLFLRVRGRGPRRL